ncbi:MAG: hypothetical protein OCD00_00765 [Colwellia sp.]
MKKIHFILLSFFILVSCSQEISQKNKIIKDGLNNNTEQVIVLKNHLEENTSNTEDELSNDSSQQVIVLKNDLEKNTTKAKDDLDEKCNIQENAGIFNCSGINLGYEFDKKSNKCKSVSWGCSEPPFSKMEDCTSLCEKKYENTKDLGDKYFLLDEKYISFNGVIIEGVDIDSFKVLSKGYAKDKYRAYI